jgi:hypothetical protein
MKWQSIDSALYSFYFYTCGFPTSLRQLVTRRSERISMAMKTELGE